MNEQKHVPVLASEVIRYLDPKPGDRYLDLTAGRGGHARMVLDKIGPEGSATLVDRDDEAIKALKDIFAGDNRVKIIHKDFLAASRSLLEEGASYDIVFADLGVSSPHLDNPDRGFSFTHSGPLDMRMDRSSGLTAETVVNEYDVDELTRILRDYGEVRNAKRLAVRMVEERPYRTTDELAKKIVQFQGNRGKKHPATAIFQAIRIAVNDELNMLEKSLDVWIELLSRMGRIGVISFHSLEDRLVKRAFRDYGGNRYDATLHILTKKAVKPGRQEIVFNPRSRSAKFRAAQRK